MKKIGLATPVYNAERWIYPFLKLTEGLDKRVLVLGKKPIEWWAKEHGISSDPDRTGALVAKYFPDVEILEQHLPGNDFTAETWNQGHEYLADCDFVFRFDADEMMLPNYWELLIERVRKHDDKSISIDFGKDAVLFRYDLDHGIPHPEMSWIETRGLKGNLRYNGIGSFSLTDSFLFSPAGFTIYHYYGWKRGEKNKETIKEKRDDWVSTPELIRELFIEGWEKLEKL